MATYRFQAYDHAGAPPSWRDIEYILDTELGYCWNYLPPGRRGPEHDAPLDELVETATELAAARDYPSFVRIVDTDGRVVWKG